MQLLLFSRPTLPRNLRALLPLVIVSALIARQAFAAPFELNLAQEDRVTQNGEYVKRAYTAPPGVDSSSAAELPVKPEVSEEVPGRYIVYHQGPPLLDVQQSALRGRSSAAARSQAAAAVRSARHAMQDERRALLSALGRATGSAVAPDEKAAAGSGAPFVKTDITLATNATVVENLKPAQVKALERAGYRVEPDRLFRVNLSSSVPLIKADEVWMMHDQNNQAVTGKGVRIGVIDTGIDWGHPDFGSCTNEQFFSGGCAKVKGGRNFISALSSPRDDGYHGTHVAGTIAGNGGLKGVAPDAELYALKVCYGGGSCPYYAILDAIDWAVDPNKDGDTSDHLDIISLSLGGCGNPDDSLSTAVDRAVNAGVVAVIAAGNAGPGSQTIGSPGTARKAITVGASSKADQITNFSSRGPVVWGNGQQIEKPDVAAPGAAIVAPLAASSGYTSLSGTSMATPHVSGVAALLLQAYPNLNPLQIKQLLKSNADPLINSATGLPYTINEQGAGRVNALRAITAASDVLMADISVSAGSQGIEVRGTAGGSGFISYTLQMHLKNSPDWTLVAQGNQPVQNGVLATLNPDYLAGGIHEFLLTANGNSSTATAQAGIRIQHAAIIQPMDLHTSSESDAARSHPASDLLSVYGTADGAGMLSYDLSLCTTDSLLKPTATCSKLGVSVIGDPGQPKKEQLLGTVDFSRIPSFATGFYALKLTVQSSGATEVNYSVFHVDADLMSGYPLTFSEPNGMIALTLFDQPVLSDINSNQTKELVYAYGSEIRALDYNGTDVFKVPLQGTELAQTPASVGDLNGDGSPEIAARTSHLLRFFKGDGSVAAPAIPRLSWLSGGQPIGLLDLNRDGKLDLLEPTMFAQNLFGQVPAGWEGGKSTSPSSQSGSWLFAAAASPGANAQATRIYSIGLASGGATLHAFSEAGGKLWSKPVGADTYSQFSAPTAVDLDKDGTLDVVFTEVVNPLGSYTVKLHGYLSNGQAAPGFPQSEPQCTDSSCGSWGCSTSNGLYCRKVPPPSVADLDIDGSPEIVILGARNAKCYSYYCTIQDCVSIYRSNGDAGTRICDTEWGFDHSVQLANTDEDEELEIVPSFSGVSGYCYGPNCRHTVMRLPAYNADGSMAAGFPKTIFDIPLSTHLPVGDLDNDGYNEMVFNGWDGQIYGWKLNACANESGEFGQHNGGPLQRREYKPYGQPLCGSGRPSAISGVVRDPQGRVVAGAEVTITLACGTFTAITDANGAFSISTPCSGGYSLSVTTPTLEIVNQQGRLGNPVALDLMLHLRRYLVSVGIENRIGSPVPEAPIRVYLNQNEMTYDSVSGRYTAQLEYGAEYSIYAEGLDGVEFFYGSVSGQVLGEVEHLLVRDSWEAS